MIRTQVQLTEHQLQALRRLSAENGVSLADLVRQSVELDLTSRHAGKREQQIERALRASGRFSSGSKDGSKHHDAYLVEAFSK